MYIDEGTNKPFKNQIKINIAKQTDLLDFYVDKLLDDTYWKKYGEKLKNKTKNQIFLSNISRRSRNEGIAMYVLSSYNYYV